MRGRAMAAVVGLGAIAIGGALLGSELIAARKQGDAPEAAASVPSSSDSSFDYGSLAELGSGSLGEAAISSDTR